CRGSCTSSCTEPSIPPEPLHRLPAAQPPLRTAKLCALASEVPSRKPKVALGCLLASAPYASTRFTRCIEHRCLQDVHLLLPNRPKRRCTHGDSGPCVRVKERGREEKRRQMLI